MAIIRHLYNRLKYQVCIDFRDTGGWFRDRNVFRKSEF